VSVLSGGFHGILRLDFFVNKALPRFFKETINRKVFQNKERKRVQKKLTERTEKNYFLIYLLFEN